MILLVGGEKLKFLKFCPLASTDFLHYKWAFEEMPDGFRSSLRTTIKAIAFGEIKTIEHTLGCLICFFEPED